MIKAIFDTSGLPTAFFDTSVIDPPDDAVEITVEQWRELIENPGARRWDGADVVAYEPPPPAPKKADVIAERDRRLAMGFTHDFGDERGLHIFATTHEDMEGWNEVTVMAQALLAADDTSTHILIVTETGVTTVTASEWQSVLLAAAAFRQPIWQASFALQALDPIPPDYSDDSYWP